MKLPPVLSSRHKEAIFLMKRMLCVLLTLLLCAASAQADAVLDTTAFNQSIVMGANVLGNTVDMTVVGGNLSSTVIGDDDLG